MTDTKKARKIVNGFDFGSPESAIKPKNIAPYLGVFESDDYYQPPVSLHGLTQLLKANHHHGTLPSFKANLFLKQYIPNKLVNYDTLLKVAIDYNTMGNGYIQLLFNRLGVVVGTKHLPALNMRVAVEGGYYYLNNRNGVNEKIYLKADAVIHIADYEPTQSIYGVPYWIGVIHSILLGEDARLVPRRFLSNGAHLGNLFLTAGLSEDDEEVVFETLGSSKGVGNGRSQYISLPKGDLDKAFKVIPIGEIGNLSEFKRLAELSASDILEAWRIRPELAGMMPENVGGSGDLFKIMVLNHEYEVEPMQTRWSNAINEHLPQSKHLSFKEFDAQKLMK